MWYFDAVLSVIPSSKIFKIQHVNGLFLNDVGVFFKKKKEKKKRNNISKEAWSLVLLNRLELLDRFLPLNQ